MSRGLRGLNDGVVGVIGVHVAADPDRGFQGSGFVPRMTLLYDSLVTSNYYCTNTV